MVMMSNDEIENSMKIKLEFIPEKIPKFEANIRRATRRDSKLSNSDIKLALKNALRYFLSLTPHIYLFPYT